MPKNPQLINVTSLRETNRGTTAIAYQIEGGRYKALNISTRDQTKKPYCNKNGDTYFRTIKGPVYSINSRAYTMWDDKIEVISASSTFYGDYPTYSKALQRVKELIQTKGNGTEKEWAKFRKLRLKLIKPKQPQKKKPKPPKPTLTEAIRSLDI